VSCCRRCHRREAVTRRRLETSVGRPGLRELVCLPCAREVDDLAERCARGVAQVDAAVSRYHGRLRSISDERKAA
jgi:hypothetical protein